MKKNVHAGLDFLHEPSGCRMRYGSLHPVEYPVPWPPSGAEQRQQQPVASSSSGLCVRILEDFRDNRRWSSEEMELGFLLLEIEPFDPDMHIYIFVQEHNTGPT